VSDLTVAKKKLKKTDLIKIKEEKYLIVDSTGENYTLLPVSIIIDGDLPDDFKEFLLPQLNIAKSFFNDNKDIEVLDDYEKLMLLNSKNQVVQKTLKKFLKV
jgi:hypothetical protein